MKISEEQVYDQLKTVIDPELKIDIVSLGLVYDVTVRWVEGKSGRRPVVHVLMTLTTPGCPLAAVFEPMTKEALRVIEGLDVEQDVSVELTFDPPWVPDMMSEEARAELGL
ncbi:MAG TPA: iron-sulfur cluster assembly protein [Patescibacteria group bacterium]